jgi:CHC2 zinc finger/Toprim-like
MARVSAEELERLKREVSLERLVAGYGLELVRHGAQDLIARCPFHADKTPSLVVTPSTNLWHCLGACQAGGSVIDWVMRAEGLSFRAAVEYLRRGGTPSLDLTKRAPPKLGTTLKTAPLAPAGAPDAEVWSCVLGHYSEALMQSAEARGYLESRGLWHEEAIRIFQIGYSNRTLGYKLPAANRQEGALLRGALQRLGVYRESGHEHLVGCITVPLSVGEMYGRRVGRVKARGEDAAVGPSAPVHLYTPGGHLAVWNASGLTEDVILCESLLDALTFWVNGYRSVTASYGVSGFTDAHLDFFRRQGVRTVRIAYDRDAAGDEAAAKLSLALNAAGIETYRVLFPRGMDANEYACKVQPARESLGLAVRKAEWLGKGAYVALPQPLPFSEPILEQPEAATVPEAAIAPEATKGAEPFEPQLREESREAGVAPQVPSEADFLPEVTGQGQTPERDELTLRFGERVWRMRGLSKNTSLSSLRCNVSVRVDSGAFFVDTLDLYAARPRAMFLVSAQKELGLEEAVLKRDLGAVLLHLEAAQEQRMAALVSSAKVCVPAMTEPARNAALGLLRDPHLADRIVEDLGACGLVGEENNKLLAYLAATSRLLERPLAVIIQSTSAAGKSSLMDAVLSLIPDEERVSFSAMTGQSLFYMGKDQLKHKVLAVSEEEGAERASYALKLLQSEGSLTIASTGKDPVSGKHVTHTYSVEGPVQLFQTTTAVLMDEELLNRCLVLTVDEGRAQTRAILAQQREGETLEGLLVKEKRKGIRALHQNAQRLLEALAVVNPFARELTFSDARTRMRRDHGKYLGLIRTVALLHQHQREIKTAEHEGKALRYVEVTRGDIEIATRIADALLKPSADELPPQTALVLTTMTERAAERAALLQMRAEEIRFTQREVRGWTGMSATTVKRHMQQLEALELLFVVRGKKTWEYMLAEASSVDGSVLEGSALASEATAAESMGTAPSVHDRTGIGPGGEWTDLVGRNQKLGSIGPQKPGGLDPAVRTNGAVHVSAPCTHPL